MNGCVWHKQAKGLSIESSLCVHNKWAEKIVSIPKESTLISSRGIPLDGAIGSVAAWIV